jgi:hypothetical protein
LERKLQPNTLTIGTSVANIGASAFMVEPIITGTLRVTDPPLGRAKDHVIIDDAGFNDPGATPETDKYYGVSPCGPGEVGTDDVEFARKLERERDKAHAELRASNQELKELLVLLARAIHDENWKEIGNLVPRMEAAFNRPEAALRKGNRP